jgi:hypothetical protein
MRTTFARTENMIVIRTAEEMARVLSAPPDSELQHILQAHWERLSEWDDLNLEDLALFIIAPMGRTEEDIALAAGRALIADGAFVLLPEVVKRSSHWAEVTCILSDDGYGIVLLIELGAGTDKHLLSALNSVDVQGFGHEEQGI